MPSTAKRPKTKTPLVDSDPTSKVMDILQVAATCKCSTKTIERVLERGEMPQPGRIGVLRRWPRPVIEEWVASRMPAPTEAGAAQ
jgi:predicted DNA-binding transcriptional regulator AlpA